MLTNFNQIVTGWSAYLIGADLICLSKAKQRAEICAGCPSAKQGSFEQLMPDHSIKEIQGMKCDQCGCPLSTSTRSKEYNCPLNKW